jgi:hypothetical protein
MLAARSLRGVILPGLELPGGRDDVQFDEGGSQVTFSCFERYLSARDSERAGYRSGKDV